MAESVAAATSAAPLWAKDLPLDQVIHRFTVGEDPDTDRVLLAHDCIGSAAHARMLAECGLLPDADLAALLPALKALHAEALVGRLTITPEQEDGHTAIEQALVERVGEAGKRIHLARSRNDQVLLAMRLWLRQAVLTVAGRLQRLVTALVELARRDADVALPGYTHLQRAMPSTVGLWAAGYAQGFTEELEALTGVWTRLDRCPLGAAAGFGVPLPIRRERVAELLGFSRVQAVVTDVIGSRGRHEQALLDAGASIAGQLEKLAWDLSLYTTAEFGFVVLPDAYTTGSSIMPQKRNPDVVELLRGRARELRSLRGLHAELAGGLPGSYHRDHQLLKAPAVAFVRSLDAALDISARVVGALQFQRERAAAAVDDTLYATHVAYRRVAEGESFRDAYRAVAAQVLAGTLAVDRDALSASHTGAARELGLDAIAAEAETLMAGFRARAARIDAATTSVFDLEPPFDLPGTP